MSDLRFSFPACMIAGKGQITPDDVGLLRRHLWPEGIRNRQQAAMAIALDECCPLQCPEWSVYLVESVTEFVVWRESAEGKVSGETAGWLLEWLVEAGAVRSTAGLDILLHVLDVARTVPNFLSATVLNQLRLALLPEPCGAYASRRVGESGVRTDDLAFVWRVLRSGLDRGVTSLSRSEILILADIDRSILPKHHHPGWHEVMKLARLDWEAEETRRPEWLDIDDAGQASHLAA